MIIVAVLVLGGGAAGWHFFGGGSSSKDERPVPRPLVTKHRIPLADVNPYEPPGPLTTDEIEAGAQSKAPESRIALWRAIVARGVADAADEGTLAAIESSLQSKDATEVIWAKGASMRVVGDRRFLLELARAAPDSPNVGDIESVVRSIDPQAGGPLMGALAATSMLRKLGARPMDWLDPLAERLAKDGRAGLAALSDAISNAKGEDLRVGLNMLREVHPIPAESLTVLLERWRRGTPADRTAIQRFLMNNKADVSAAGPDVSAFLVERFESAAEPDWPLWGALVRRLPSLDPTLATRMIDRARKGTPAEAQSVFAALTSMGPRAKGAARELIALAATLPESLRPVVAQSLPLLGANEVLAYAAERLVAGNAVERQFWLDSLSSAGDPQRVLAPLQTILHGADEDEAMRAATALVRVTSHSPSAERVAILSSLLDDARAPIRTATIIALDAVETIPADLVPRLEKATGDPDSLVRSAALVTVSGVWRLRADGKPFVPTLLRIAALPAARSFSGSKSRALRSLATIVPADPDARAAFLASASDTDFDAKQAAIWGLSRQASPTPAEKAAVLAAKSDARLSAIVNATLSRPAWQAVEPPR
jgi:hypothetical protein